MSASIHPVKFFCKNQIAFFKPELSGRTSVFSVAGHAAPDWHTMTLMLCGLMMVFLLVIRTENMVYIDIGSPPLNRGGIGPKKNYEIFHLTR